MFSKNVTMYLNWIELTHFAWVFIRGFILFYTRIDPFWFVYLTTSWNNINKTLSIHTRFFNFRSKSTSFSTTNILQVDVDLHLICTLSHTYNKFSFLGRSRSALSSKSTFSHTYKVGYFILKLSLCKKYVCIEVQWKLRA